MKLTNEQIDILKEIKVDGNKIYLQGQLDRKQYININQVLETIGAKWNKKEKVHIAEGLTNEDLINALSEIYETGEVETLKDIVKKYQFYPTPKEVVEYLVELAEIKENDEVIEPSAGDGAILKVILEKYPVGFIKIYANEIYRDRYLELLKILDKVSQDDFLNFNNMYFDKFIMNPPFAKSQDVKHILKAYELLKDGGRIVSVASSSIQYREGQLYEELRALNPEFIELPEGSFKESGTMVNSIIVVINK